MELPDSLPKDALMLLKEVEIKQCPLLIHRLDGESEVIAPPRRKWGGDVDGNRAPRGAAPSGKGGFSKPGFGNKKPGGAGGFGGNKPPAKRRAPREG